MKKTDLYPLKFKEIYKHYPWGGKNLRRIGKRIGKREIVAESWELADHEKDVSIVKNGSLRGMSLGDLVSAFGADMCPPTANGRFPVLLKFIDANDKLSVQVHPDDEYAKKHESPTELGKTELWYIMEADPGTEIILGLKEGTTRESFRWLIEHGSIEEALKKVQVEEGDVFYIKAGTVHTILGGALVCEIQENSDTTYRVYDWGRLGKDGMHRPLHIEKALDVIRFPGKPGEKAPQEGLIVKYDKSSRDIETPLVRGRFFNVNYMRCTKECELLLGNYHFHALIILSGKGTIRHEGGEEGVEKGETVLLPRPLGKCTIHTGGIAFLNTFL